MKKILFLLCIVFLISSTWSISFGEQKGIKAGKKLYVVTTLFPLYDFSRAVGGEKIHVTLLLPPGTEAHTFEPAPHDIVRISKADVFIYTGRLMEPWVDDILSGVVNKNLLVVDTSKDIELIDTHDPGEKDRSFHHTNVSEKHNHHHYNKDPHIWLDPHNAVIMVTHIADAFIKKDPENKIFYKDNAERYKTRLMLLDMHIKNTLSNCKKRTFIHGGHFQFGYFTRRYNLKHIAAYKGSAPDTQPGPRRIAELIKKARKLDIKYIFYEELISPKVAKVIADETGAQLLLLHGIHNVSKEELTKGVTYISLMKENLERLKLGLECE
jgi:zinc transport system substrate-binding protein